MPKLGGHCPLDRVKDPIEHMRRELGRYYISRNLGLPTSPLSNLPVYAVVSHGKETLVKTGSESVTEVVRRAVLNDQYVDEALLKEEYCRYVCENALC